MAAFASPSMKKHCAVALLLVALIAAACVLPAAAQTTAAPTWPCNVAQCSICSIGFPNTCVVCEAGYTLMNSGKCKLTGTCSVAQCQQCFTDDDNLCQTCQQGYRVTVSGQCRRTGSSGALRPLSTAAVAVLVAALMYAAAML